MKLIFYVYIFLFSVGLIAGPVNSFDSFPFSAMNTDGDFVLAGNIKAYVKWHGKFIAVPSKLAVDSKSLFTGGISERKLIDDSPAALVCSSNIVAFFYPTKNLGAWKIEKSTSGATYRCSMSNDGSWAIWDMATSKLTLSNGSKIDIASKYSAGWITTIADHFVIVHGKIIIFVNREGKVKYADSPFSQISNLTRIIGNDNYLMQADDYGVYLVKTDDSDKEGFPILGKKIRVPVSPCAENQACGVSLASDNSWVVSGYWGTWIGNGEEAKRLRMPNLSREFGGIAFAHSGNGGFFVYAANDDGDMGKLPVKKFTTHESAEENIFRYAVWLKEDSTVNNDIHSVIVPKVKYGKNLTGSIIVHEGQLPNKIPANWLFWESEVVTNVDPTVPVSFESDGLWWVDDIGRDKAWQYAIDYNMSSRDVLIGVVDSGIEVDHELLKQNLSINSSEVVLNGVDDDLNGFIDDIIGYDFVKEDAIPDDKFGHGTHVAGLISGGNGFAVAKNSKLVVARALGRSGKSNSIDLARAISYTVDRGVRIINCSWGGGSSTEALKDAFLYAFMHDVMVFTSSGNSGLDHDKSPQVPGEFDGVISVGAYNSAGRKAKFSNYGQDTVAFMAPGENILSAIIGNQMGIKSGTSMASPIAASVAGWVMGLLIDQKPDLSQKKLVELTFDIMCDRLNVVELTKYSTCGAINAFESTQRVHDLIKRGGL